MVKRSVGINWNVREPDTWPGYEETPYLPRKSPGSTVTGVASSQSEVPEPTAASSFWLVTLPTASRTKKSDELRC
jgi:hypothetical protein